MSITPDQITAALKKLGPSSPGALADHLHVEQSALMYHVRKMIGDKALKAAGTTANRRIALPEQEIETATPQPRRAPAKGKKGKGARKVKKARKARTPRAAEPLFIPTVDVDTNLVLVTVDGVQRFTEQQTLAVATLLAAHFE